MVKLLIFVNRVKFKCSQRTPGSIFASLVKINLDKRFSLPVEAINKCHGS